jgi:hypothetical protein
VVQATPATSTRAPPPALPVPALFDLNSSSASGVVKSPSLGRHSPSAAQQMRKTAPSPTPKCVSFSLSLARFCSPQYREQGWVGWLLGSDTAQQPTTPTKKAPPADLLQFGEGAASDVPELTGCVAVGVFVQRLTLALTRADSPALSAEVSSPALGAEVLSLALESVDGDVIVGCDSVTLQHGEREVASLKSSSPPRTGSSSATEQVHIGEGGGASICRDNIRLFRPICLRRHFCATSAFLSVFHTVGL